MVAGPAGVPPGSRRAVPATWKKIRQRNRFYRLLPYLPVSALISRAATKTATSITLPSYDQVPA